MTSLADRHGSGSFRRRVRLSHDGDGVALGGIEDEMHHFRVRVEHDGSVVTAVSGEDVRVPWETCSGALARLDDLVGAPLRRSFLAALRRTDARTQCTHLLDLAALTIAHAASGRPPRQLDAEVPDWTEAPFTARILVDGELVLDWTIGADRVITSPPYTGVSLRRGFSMWCEANLDPDLAEAATVLHRAAWMAPARHLDLESFDTVADSGIGEGVCWTTQPGQISLAVRNRGTLRDYGASAEGLLGDFGLDA